MNKKDLFLYALMITLMVLFLFPIFFLFTMSLNVDFRRLEIFPSNPSLEGFLFLFTQHRYFGLWFINSLIYAGCSTMGIIATGCVAGYIFSRYRFPGRTVLFWTVLGVMMIPSAVIYVPQFVLLSNLHLINSMIGVVFPLIISPYSIFLFKQACDTIPREYEEAAMIDGAGALTRFVRLVLPLLKPVILTTAAIQFVWNWNNFVWPLFIVSSSELYNLSYGVYNFSWSQGAGNNYPALGAISLVNMLVPLVVYILLYKYIVKGIVLYRLR